MRSAERAGAHSCGPRRADADTGRRAPHAPLLVALAVAAVLVLTPVAAADVVEDAGRALQRQSVLAAPETTPLSQADVGRLQRQIAGSGQDIHIAILPGSAGDPVTVLRALNDRIGGHGVVGVVVGRHFRAGANRDAGFSVGDLATEAVQSHRGDAPAALTDFVRRVQKRADGGGRIGAGGNVSGVSVLPLLLIVILAAGGIAAFSCARNRRRRRERDAQLSDVKRTANEDLVALGDDIRALDIDTQMPGADPGAKSDYERAVLGYDAANRRLGAARTLDDLKAWASSSRMPASRWKARRRVWPVSPRPNGAHRASLIPGTDRRPPRSTGRPKEAHHARSRCAPPAPPTSPLDASRTLAR
jgi:opacity protein-like surface antigen